MAINLTKANVVLIAPELASVGDPTWTKVIADVLLQINEAAFGVRAAIAAENLCAHAMTFAAQASGAVTGPVQSESVGDVSVSYAVSVSAAMTDLGSTKYGQEYRRQMRLNIDRMFTV